MCGTCCVVYTIDEPNLKKGSYKRCPNLVYEGNKALCGIHETKGGCQPATCKEYDAQTRQKTVWFDDRFKCYKQREFMEHWAWCAKHGHLDHLPIMQAIAKRNYSTAIVDKVFRYFFHPFLKQVPGTLAAEDGWFTLWGDLAEYVIRAPDKAWDRWQALDAKDKTYVMHVSQLRTLRLLNLEKALNEAGSAIPSTF